MQEELELGKNRRNKGTDKEEKIYQKNKGIDTE
jgi:hypothetical protein